VLCVSFNQAARAVACTTGGVIVLVVCVCIVCRFVFEECGVKGHVGCCLRVVVCVYLKVYVCNTLVFAGRVEEVGEAVMLRIGDWS
jgi:hypothetical protein